jgi:mitochondrial fission protein ELM1
LIKALGWRHEVKTLNFRGPEIPALAPLLLKNGEMLGPPWPDLVLCAEALPGIVALDLKNKSTGALKAVCIGRPAGSPAGFDLVITTAQYRLPAAANIVELSMPLSTSDTESEIPGYSVEARRQLIAVLVGGTSFPDRLDLHAARRMADELRQYADKRQGTLAVVTSPRTSLPVVQLLSAALAPPHRVHAFGPGENFYRPVLASADEIIVTSDSVSMVADALKTGRPVSVYSLPQDLNLQWRLTEWLYRHAVARPSPWLFPVRWLFNKGVIEATADRRLLFRKLVETNRLNWFGKENSASRPGDGEHDLATAVESLRALVI